MRFEFRANIESNILVCPSYKGIEWLHKTKGPFITKDDNYKDNEKDIVLKIALNIKE